MKLKTLYLTEEQLHDPNFRKVNLACGKRLYPGVGWTNLDLSAGTEPRVTSCDLWWLDWPGTEEGTVDYVLASHILEHVPHYHPEYGEPFWYHWFPYLLSLMKDESILEIWGPDPDRRPHPLQYVGHTRLIGPASFKEYTEPASNFSSLENLDSRRGYKMELILHERRKTIRLGRVDDYHFIRYLGPAWRDRIARLIGHKDELRMVFRIRRIALGVVE